MRLALLSGRPGASRRQLIVYTPEYFRKERRIEVRTGARVVAISHPRREVALEGGERVRYDRLVIATGRASAHAGLRRRQAAARFHAATLRDAQRLKAYLRDQQPKRAVIVGAGYIGLEAADALRRNGLAVTVVEQSGHVLGRERCGTDQGRTRAAGAISRGPATRYAR